MQRSISDRRGKSMVKFHYCKENRKKKGIEGLFLLKKAKELRG